MALAEFRQLATVDFGRCQIRYLSSNEIRHLTSVECNSSKSNTCQVLNLSTRRPCLKKQAHVSNTHCREPAQPRQFNMQLVRERVNCAASPFGIACLLRNVASDKDVPLHSRDAPLSPAPEDAICRFSSHLPFAFWTILYQNKTGSSSSEKIHSRMSDWMRFFVIAPAMIPSFHSHELYQMPPIL